MILVKLNNALTLGLYFLHPLKMEATGELVLDESTGTYVQDVVPIRHTRCEILEVREGMEDLRPDELSILAVATVRCHPLDNFCKETGRKLSLKQAMLVLHPPLTKKEREVVWRGYLERPRPVSHRKGCPFSTPGSTGPCTCASLTTHTPLPAPHLSIEEVNTMIERALLEEGLTGG